MIFFAFACLVFLFSWYVLSLWWRTQSSTLAQNYQSVGGTVADDILSEEDYEYIRVSEKLFRDVEKKNQQLGKLHTYQGHAQFVSDLLKKQLIDVEGLRREKAHELFLLHRESGPIVEGGLGVRVTVQLNLFGGSVANLGNDTQRKWLQGVFDRGELGCFCLTEQGAGVLSGLVSHCTVRTQTRPSVPPVSSTASNVTA